MAVPLYMDVQVPQQITDQLRRRGADVLTAIEDGWAEAADEDLLEHARELGRVVLTQDIRFRAMAEDWQRQADLVPDSYSAINSAARSGNSSRIWT